MATFEAEIRTEIAAQAFTDGNTLTPTYFLGVEPSSPVFAVTIVPEAGAAGTRRIGEFPSFTVRVRHSNAGEANLFLRRIFEFLQEFQGRLGSSPLFAVARIQANAGPVQIGRDQSSPRQGGWVVQQTFNAITRFVTQP